MNTQNLEQQEVWNEFHKTVHSTEEYAKLIEYIREINGDVIHTFSLREHGRGICVHYRLKNKGEIQ